MNEKRPADVPVLWSVRGQSAACDYARQRKIAVNLADLGDCADVVIAAVWPLIEAAERETCASLVQGFWQQEPSTAEERALLEKVASKILGRAA